MKCDVPIGLIIYLVIGHRFLFFMMAKIGDGLSVHIMCRFTMDWALEPMTGNDLF